MFTWNRSFTQPADPAIASHLLTLDSQGSACSSGSEEMTEIEDLIREEAQTFARRNKKAIARRFTNPEIYVPEEQPVAVFMAGSPGAGKTEASKRLLERFDSPRTLRIDPDDLRTDFPGYTGANSWLFQGAVSIVVAKILDMAFSQSQSFLLDGTLSAKKVAHTNIERAIKHNRFTQILYVYQDPMLAWAFVCAREALEGRRIPAEDFAEQYFAARDVVNGLKSKFGKKLRVDLLIKNVDGSDKVYKANIEKIDFHVPEKYDRTSLIQEIQG